MQYTTNYQFKMPDQTDNYNIQNQNDNWSSLDTVIKNLNTSVSNAQNTANAAIPASQKGAANGVAGLDANALILSGNLPKATSGSLGAVKVGSGISSSGDGTISASASSVGAIANSLLGQVNGVASLDSNGLVPVSQIPSLNYIPTSQKGSAYGIATLDGTGKVPTAQIPSITNSMLATAPNFGFANLLRPSIANFTRISVAWRRNFSQVVANQLRTEMGAMGDAPYIEESTSNIFTANQSNIETDTTGFTANNTGTTLSRDTSSGNYLEGSASLKIVCDGTVSSQGLVANVTASASTTYTASVWLKGSGTVQLSLSGAAITQVTSSPITLTNNWTRYLITGTTNASGGSLNFVVMTNSAQNVTFWADALQIEQKAYATSFVTGGTTRNADSLSYTLDKPLPASWSDSIRWKPDLPSNANRSNGSVLLSSPSKFEVGYLYSSGKFYLSDYTHTDLSIPFTFNAGDTIFVEVINDTTSGTRKLYVSVNGGSLQTTSDSNALTSTSIQQLYVGCSQAGGYEANGTVETLLTTTIPTTEQLNWLYNAPLWGQGNFPVNSNPRDVVSLSGGTRIQSGSAAVSGTSNVDVSVTVTFPTAFTTAPQVVATSGGSQPDLYGRVSVGNITTTGFTLTVKSDFNGSWGMSAQWIAIGN